MFSKNPGFKTVKEFAELLSGEAVEATAHTTADWSIFKFCPTTSCDVERSFSSYKLLFSDRRTNFTNDNLEKHLVCYANAKFEDMLDGD